MTETIGTGGVVQGINERIDDRIESILDTLGRAEKEISSQLSGRASEATSASTITVNAGGAGIWMAAWIASVCCAMSLVTMAFGIAWMLHQAKQIDDLNAYIQAVYQVAPALQETLKQKEKEH
jgi:hypothetical protein